MTTFSAGCDTSIRMWNVTQPATSAQVIGKHDAPIKCLKFITEMSMVATGSWDKTVKLWDARSPNPVAQAQVGERVYAMDATSPAIVIGTADRQLHVYDLTKGLSVCMMKYPAMDYQTRCISIFSDKAGFAAGSIEGRCMIEYFDELGKKSPEAKRNFIFKCHRVKHATDPAQDIYGVNAVAFTNRNTFATGGSDGNIVIWDKDQKSRLTTLDKFEKQTTISALTFNPMSNLLFYAHSYDWSMGQHSPLVNTMNQIWIHPVDPAEITSKTQQNQNRNGFLRK